MKCIGQLFAFLLMLLVAACSSNERKLTSKEIKMKADSIFNVKKVEVDKAATEDLEQRKAIEVKAIADSIVNVRKYGAPKPDPAAPVVQEEMIMPDSVHALRKRTTDSMSSANKIPGVQRAAAKRLRPSS